MAGLAARPERQEWLKGDIASLTASLNQRNGR